MVAEVPSILYGLESEKMPSIKKVLDKKLNILYILSIHRRHRMNTEKNHDDFY